MSDERSPFAANDVHVHGHGRNADVHDALRTFRVDALWHIAGRLTAARQ